MQENTCCEVLFGQSVFSIYPSILSERTQSASVIIVGPAWWPKCTDSPCWQIQCFIMMHYKEKHVWSSINPLCVRHLEQPHPEMYFTPNIAHNGAFSWYLLHIFHFTCDGHFSQLHYGFIDMFGMKMKQRELKVMICEMKFDSAYHRFNSFMN